MSRVYPIILSGGVGSRLWPLSRTLLPKQFLPLLSHYTLLQETVLRLEGLALAAPVVVCNHEHRFLVAEQLREIGVSPFAQILEPEGRNTAPAVAVAALCVLAKDPQALLLVLPADHLIRDITEFHAAIKSAVALAEQNKLVAFGIKPTEPNTGYGYIQRAKPMKNVKRAFEVGRFVEKPSLHNAKKFLASKNFFWNSGMFLFSAQHYLEELRGFSPQILQAAQKAWDKHTRDLDFYRLNPVAFAQCPSNSIDYAVMEKTQDAVVLAVNMGWSDIGSWSALWETGKKDKAGNVIRGDVHLDEVEHCYIRAEGRLVTAVGLKDLIIVETADAILVAHKDSAQKVKNVVEHLKSKQRDEYLVHKRVYRPWGYYEGIDSGERFQVKRIMVKPGSKLSLQMHHHRAEHWVVVSGTAKVIRGEEEILLSENQSTYIPLGTKHRLENPGKSPLHLIEVQSGGYLGEDDIVRFADDYKRM